MIVFDLACANAHVFEAWFGSTADYESQRARRLIACPACDDTGITKAAMAPAVPAKANTHGVARLLAAQRDFEAAATWVGPAFAEQARARHDAGESGPGIYGEATAAEAIALAADGIPVMPLPFRPRIRSDA